MHTKPEQLPQAGWGRVHCRFYRPHKLLRQIISSSPCWQHDRPISDVNIAVICNIDLHMCVCAHRHENREFSPPPIVPPLQYLHPGTFLHSWCNWLFQVEVKLMVASCLLQHESEASRASVLALRFARYYITPSLVSCLGHSPVTLSSLASLHGHAECYSLLSSYHFPY